MRAACYEKQGSAKDDLTLGEMPDRHPAVGEVCIRIAASDINPGDIKKRPSDLPSANSLIGRPMPDWERGAFRRICWHQSNVLSLGSAGQTGRRAAAERPNDVHVKNAGIFGDTSSPAGYNSPLRAIVCLLNSCFQRSSARSVARTQVDCKQCESLSRRAQNSAHLPHRSRVHGLFLADPADLVASMLGSRPSQLDS